VAEIFARMVPWLDLPGIYCLSHRTAFECYLWLKAVGLLFPARAFFSLTMVGVGRLQPAPIHFRR
jgi:hypothetical protein